MIDGFPNTKIDNCLLINGDCLEVMDKMIKQGIKVDAIITDIPYGTTACSWDSVIPFDKMWIRLNQLIIDNRAIALFGSEPFSSALRMSNINHYKYDWYWNKKFGGNFVQAKRMPLKSIEMISIFCISKNLPNYYPQMMLRDKPIMQGGIKTSEAIPIKNNTITHTKKVYTHKYPLTELSYPKPLGKTVHPTQKPTELLEYLIKTYTNENELVLDFTAGSFSTGIACQNTNRKFIGIELEEKYYNIGIERITNNRKREEDND